MLVLIIVHKKISQMELGNSTLNFIWGLSMEKPLKCCLKILNLSYLL